MNSYTPEQIRELLTEDVINAAFEMGFIYERDDVNECMYICFPHESDPGCQLRYIPLLSTTLEDYKQMPDDIIAQTITESLIVYIEQDPESYAEEITEYVNQILGRKF